MKPVRVSAVAVAAVLAPVVLLSSPAMAATAAGPGTVATASPAAKDYSHMSMDDLRVEVLSLMGKSPQNSSMRSYGDAALKKDTAVALIEFLQVTQYKAQEEDDRVAVLVILGKHPGRGVTDAANKALNGSAADVRHFLEVGQYQAQEDDDRVAVLVILGKHPGRGVTDAANKALNGSAADVRHFLEVGQYEAQEEDDRVEVLRLMANHPSEKFRTAGSKALDGGPAAVRQFLKVGQYQVR